MSKLIRGTECDFIAQIDQLSILHTHQSDILWRHKVEGMAQIEIMAPINMLQMMSSRGVKR